MDFVPKYFKTNPLSHVVTIESVSDIRGNVYFAVTLSKGAKNNIHYLFKHLSSAIDFVESNFS